MVKVARYDQQGTQTGEAALSESIFAIEVNEDVVHQAVVAQQSAKRAGTASTKTRSEKRGGGRKPWRQKGTGRARHGSIRSPLWVGGGVTFGPKPKEYKNNLPKKMRKLAVRSVLSAKVQDGELAVIDNLEFSQPRTRDMVNFLQKIDAPDKVLIVIGNSCENTKKSGRNIPGVQVINATSLNPYDLLNNQQIFIVEDALPVVEEVFAPDEKSA